MAIKKIGEFTSGTPTASDKILIEQNGAGKSTTVENLGKAIGINTDLLWTNSSTSSYFSEQNISLDLSKYKYIMINFYFDTINSKLSCLYLLSKTNKTIRISNIYDQYGIAREIKSITDSIVSFGSGIETKLSDGAYRELNSLMIPYQIYGVK